MSEVRRRFLGIDTFYMTREELARADKTARLVASDWMSDTPMQDFEQGRFKITRVDEVDETQLFDDSIHCNPEDNENDSSPSSTCSNADTHSFSASVPSSTWTTPFSSIGGPSSASIGSSAESDGPITPETRPVQPAEAVPELPKDLRPLANMEWVLSADEVRVFHKTLPDHAAQAAEHGLNRLHP